MAPSSRAGNASYGAALPAAAARDKSSLNDDRRSLRQHASPARDTSQAAPHTTHFTPPTSTSRTTHNLTTHNAQLQAQRGAEKLFSTGVESLPSLEAGVERLLLASNPARTFPCMPLFMPCPTLIPSLATSTCSCSGLTEARSCSSRASWAVLPFIPVRLARRGRSLRQLQVRWRCSCDRARVFCRVPIVRTPEHVEARGQPCISIGR